MSLTLIRRTPRPGRGKRRRRVRCLTAFARVTGEALRRAAPLCEESTPQRVGHPGRFFRFKKRGPPAVPLLCVASTKSQILCAARHSKTRCKTHATLNTLACLRIVIGIERFAKKTTQFNV